MSATIQRPTSAAYDADRRISRLEFGSTSIMPNGDYAAHGGICWPVEWGTWPNSATVGFVLMGAENLKTHVLYIVEQSSYVCVDPIIRQDTGMIVNDGIARWINDCWTHWTGRRYYYRQDELTFTTWSHRIRTSAMITCKPMFDEIEWSEDRVTWAPVWERLTTGRLLYQAGSELDQQMQQDKRDKRDHPPAVRALLALVAGLDLWPNRARVID